MGRIEQRFDDLIMRSVTKIAEKLVEHTERDVKHSNKVLFLKPKKSSLIATRPLIRVQFHQIEMQFTIITPLKSDDQFENLSLSLFRQSG